jgi:peroxiredoxin
MALDPRPALLERPIARAVIAVVLLLALAGGALVVYARRDAANAPAVISATPAASVSGSADAGTGPLDSNVPVKGQPAPDFALRDASGKLVKLSDFRGKVVFVNFWASWCVPCRKEMPDIQSVYDEKKSQGLEVLAVNWEDSADTASGFLASRNLTLPLLLDRAGRIYDQYKLQGLPDSFFIDREGNLAALQYGPLTRDKMIERLKTAGLP